MLKKEFDLKAWKIPPEILVCLNGIKPVLLSIFGDINRQSVDDAVGALMGIQSDQSLLVVIDSSGGSQDGMRIANLISQLEVPVAALVLGRAGSMAAAILMSVPKEARFAFPGTTFLLHQGSTTMSVGGKIDVSLETIGALPLEISHQKLDMAWESTQDFQILLNGQIAINLGEKVTIGGHEMNVEDFVRCEEWISERQAVTIGLIQRVVGGFEH